MNRYAMTKLAREMNAKIVSILNDFEVTTGYTVDDLSVARESDDRSEIVSAKPFIYFMPHNRNVEPDKSEVANDV